MSRNVVYVTELVNWLSTLNIMCSHMCTTTWGRGSGTVMALILDFLVRIFGPARNNFRSVGTLPIFSGVKCLEPVRYSSG